MSIAQQIDQFFKAIGQSVFIEAEAKESRMLRFIQEYNTNYIPNINLGTDGIIALDEGADKRGLELRCYFENDMGFPVMNMVRGIFPRLKRMEFLMSWKLVCSNFESMGKE